MTLTTDLALLLPITALLPLTALLLVAQSNPYQTLVLRGILGAVAALVYALLGAADVALTEALVGTLLSTTLYAVARRSSMALRLSYPADDPPSEASQALASLQAWMVLPRSRQPVSPNTAMALMRSGRAAGRGRPAIRAASARSGRAASHTNSESKARWVVAPARRSRIGNRVQSDPPPGAESPRKRASRGGQPTPAGSTTRAIRPDGDCWRGATRA
jgi:putative multicomponent Na+:H+ antiporter subunit B